MSTVLATFSVLKDHVKLKVSQDSVIIDNLVFKLHYRATFLILLISTLLVTSRQYIGEHIRCIANSAIPEHVINSFCFFTSTYTVAKHMNVTLVEMGEIAHPGVGPASKVDQVVHHAYYQWVPFVLFFQAILFYVPHYLWRNAEGGHLKTLVSGLRTASMALQDTRLTTDNGITIPSKEERREKIQEIRSSFLRRVYLYQRWSYYLAFCEALNFLNVLLQIYLTDWFLGGAFLGLGQSVSEEHTSSDMDPLDIVFPKVTKCIFHKYGPSGTIEQHDALCVMALNIINEKIYTFLWFWFIILAVITGLALLWRLLTMLLYSRSLLFNKIMFTMVSPGKYNPWNVLKTPGMFSFGNWLFLYYIAKNLDNYVFKDLVYKLAEDTDGERQVYRRLPSNEQEFLKQVSSACINALP